MLRLQSGAATDDDEEAEDFELGTELLLGVIELELGRDELLSDDGALELATELDVLEVDVPQRVPVNAGTSAAAAPLVP